MSDQLMLFKFNSGMSPGADAPDVFAYEAEWVDELFRQASLNTPALSGAADLKAAIERVVEADTTGPSAAREFVDSQMTLDQFKVIAAEYAVDGLTEADAMFAAVPRLSGAAKSAVMRILIDEFGCGNPARVHAELYRALLAELGMETRVEAYAGAVNGESLAFVNVYHWLTKRAPTVDYYLGALAYTEMCIPRSFVPYVAACRRLGVKRLAYFAEHVHIDEFHAKDSLLALDSVAAERSLDLQAAWHGLCLARFAGEQAFAAAVRKAGGPSDV